MPNYTLSLQKKRAISIACMFKQCLEATQRQRTYYRIVKRSLFYSKPPLDLCGKFSHLPNPLGLFKHIARREAFVRC